MFIADYQPVGQGAAFARASAGNSASDVLEGFYGKTSHFEWGVRRKMVIVVAFAVLSWAGVFAGANFLLGL